MQKRFIKFRDPITSFEANEKYTGIIEPTVYRGFDNIVSNSGLNLTIGHALTGERFTQKSGTISNPRGIWVSKQGIVVKEDESIEITIETNATNNYERWDLLVAEHSYDELSPGGLPANYAVLKGGNKADPVLGNPAYQVVIGRLKIPASASTAVGITYERVRTPQLGGKFAAILKEVNRFENQIQAAHGTSQVTTQALELANRSVITSLPLGNTFLITNTTGKLDLLPNLPDGTEITLIFTEDTVIYQQTAQRTTVGGLPVTSGYAQGLRPLSFSSAQPGATITVNKGDAIKLVKTVNSSATIPNNEYWSVISVSSTISTVTDLAIRMSALEASVNTISTNFTALQTTVNNHTSNSANPHGVTKSQVGLGNLPNAKSDSTTLDDPNVLATSRAVKQAADAATNGLNTHASNQSNPHNVTKAQVGLGNLPNAKSDGLNVNDTNILATAKAVYDLNQIVATISGVPAGTVVMWWGGAIPVGWALCDGQNGTPNLLGRVPVGTTQGGNVPAGSSPSGTDNGRTRIVTKGNIFGNWDHLLTLNQIPSHYHFMFNNNMGQEATSGNPSISTVNYADKGTNGSGTNDEKYRIMGSGTLPTLGRTSSSGGSEYHNISQPSFGIEFIMKL